MSNVTEVVTESTGYDISTYVTDYVTADMVGKASRFCLACVEDYLESKVSRWLWAYLSPALILLGTVGNLLTLCVLGSKYHKASPINVALAFLAVADLCVLYVSLVHQWVRFVWGHDLRISSNLGCKLHLPLTLFVMALSPNMLALTTVERVISVVWPFKVSTWVTKKRMIWACLAMTSLVFACHVPLFVAVYLDPSVPSFLQCQWHSPAFTQYWYWFSFVINFFGPFLVIVTGNASIIAHLSMVAFKRSSSVTATAKKTSSTTAMLVVVGVVYFLTMTPHSVYRLGVAYGAWANRPEVAYARLRLVVALGFQLTYVNSAVNFLLYCLAGSRFRATARRMICGGRTGSSYQQDTPEVRGRSAVGDNKSAGKAAMTLRNTSGCNISALSGTQLV